jgi:putative chitinase
MAFEFDFTEQKLGKILTRNKKVHEWYEAMVVQLPQFQVNTAKRVAAFVAQCAHESADFTVLSENLNYSADALNKLFGKYFAAAGRDAAPYHRKPEMIANVIYASRMGNGDTASGEGYKFRGRGPIQLTGKANYHAFATDFFEDPETVMNDPDLVTDDIPTALYSALWFWNKNNLNREADSGDIKLMTKKINGGYIGLEDRIKHYNHAIEVLTA